MRQRAAEAGEQGAGEGGLPPGQMISAQQEGQHHHPQAGDQLQPPFRTAETTEGSLELWRPGGAPGEQQGEGEGERGGTNCSSHEGQDCGGQAQIF